MLDKLERIFRDVVGVELPPADVDLIDTGLLDSLMLVMVLAEIETAFSITIALEELDLEDIRTVGRLVALVQRQRQRADSLAEPAEAVDQLVVLLREGSDGAPVFLIPSVTGVPLGLRPLAYALQTTRPVYGLARVGLEHRDGPLRVEDMADAYAQAIRTVRKPGACVIAGISFGGLVAFETARRLSAAGEPVEHVVLFDARPAIGSLTRAAYWRFRIKQPFRILRYVLPDPRSRAPEVVRRALPFLRASLPSKPRSDDRPPSEASRWLAIADRAGRAYRPGTYDGSVTLFVTSKPPLSTFDPATVWSRRVNGDFSVHPIPGGHTDFLGDSDLGAVAAQFSRLLQASDARAQPTQPTAVR